MDAVSIAILLNVVAPASNLSSLFPFNSDLALRMRIS
jgi:hypothetical protein